MIDHISSDEFVRAFGQMGRRDDFSIQALRGLYDYLEGVFEDTGVEYELDVIELCCEYAEATVTELIEDYDLDLDEDATLEDAVEALERRTTVAWSGDVWANNDPGDPQEAVLFVAY